MAIKPNIIMVYDELPPPPNCKKIVAIIYSINYLVKTSPIRCTVVLSGTVLALTVISLSCKPDLQMLLKVTLITPLSPGLIGVCGHSGVVQPQVAVALLITNGDLPVLVNLKS